MKFFFDVSISSRLVRALVLLAEHQKYTITHLNEKFGPETADVVWLGELGRERDWIVVSADPRISRSRAERAAWAEARLTAFFFDDSYSNASFWNQAATLMSAWPDIVQRAKDEPRGSGFLVGRNGKFKPIARP